MQLFAATKGVVFSKVFQKPTSLNKPRKNYYFGLRIMKITAFILFALCLQVSARTDAQENITLKEKGASLFKIFTEIKKQTGYNFFLSGETMQSAKPIDIEVKNASLKQVLEICFKNQPLTYSITGKTIIIAVKKNEIDQNQTSDNTSVIRVKGKVVSLTGEPISGATVSIRGSTKSTVTNTKGEFSLNDVNEDAVLIITCVGYESTLININGRNIIDVVLQIKITSLDELQVIAYGTTTKRLNTGNVSSVKATDIEKQPVNNPILALEGRVPGMEITQLNGLPGAAVQVKIRGTNSIRSGNDPLYIIDGVPYSSRTLPQVAGINIFGDASTGSPFNFINPADIESISILKDADATAIYGSRGANGVVLITTKKGRSGETVVDINVQSGAGKVDRKMKLLNTRQYLDMRYEAFRNDGETPDPNVDYDLTLWDTTRFTDWQKELIGGTAKYNDIQATVSGGNINTQFLLAGAYHKETTVYPGSFYDQKGSLHININNSSQNKKFKISVSNIIVIDDSHLAPLDLTNQAVKLQPNAPALFNPDGSLNWEPNRTGKSTWPGGINPAGMLFSKYNTKTNNLITNANLSYELLTNLQFKSSFGYTYMQANQFSAVPFASIDPSTWPQSQRISNFGNNNIQSWIIEPQLTYKKNIGKNSFSFLIGSTIQKSKSNGQTIAGIGFNNDLAMEDLQSATSVGVGSTTYSVYRYNAIFGRLNYNFQDKYLANITARRDGSSRFGPANRFSNFGAVGIGWIFSNEGFIHDKIPYLSYGKIRTSYGTTGNDQVGDYSFMDLYTSNLGAGVPYQGSNGIAPNSLYTPDLAWEKTNKFETGIELSFLNERIYFTGSYYLNRSSNQLLDYYLPAITGATSIRRNLNALVQNQGIELELKILNIKSKYFSWTTSINASSNGNKLISTGNGVSESLKQSVGHSLSGFFAYHFVDVNPITGLYEVSDANGNITNNPSPTDATSVIITAPKYYGGIINSITYKNFYLDILIQFVRKPQAPIYLYNYIPGYFSAKDGGNQPVSVLNRWRKPGDVTNIQKFSQNFSVLTSFINARDSDLPFGDGSYARLKNVSLSWLLPKNVKQACHLKSARLYIQGQNLLTLSSYQGLDPETTSSTSLPPLKVLTVGLQISL